jgi:hypothetical protein
VDGFEKAQRRTKMESRGGTLLNGDAAKWKGKEREERAGGGADVS